MPGCIASRAPALRHAAPHLVTLLWISSRPAASQEARLHRITYLGMSARRPASPHGAATSRHTPLRFIMYCRIPSLRSAAHHTNAHSGARLRTRAGARTSRQAALHRVTRYMHPTVQLRIASRMAVAQHGPLHLITHRRKDAPWHVRTHFNISALDAAREDAALQTWSPIRRFAEAADGMQRLLLPCTGACAK
jgi:hypothetical protein